MTTPAKDSPLTLRLLWRQFLPLSVSDVTMAAGDPLITTTLAHLPLATANLAALGVAKALAVFFESPIIMVLHASNALSPTVASRLALRRFVLLACTVLTALLLLLVLPPVFSHVAGGLMGVSAELIPLSREALLFLVLWPAIIGWRRYYQGLLIRQGHSNTVAKAGIIRLVVVSAILACGYLLNWNGIRLAGLALIGGISSEALAVTIAAKTLGVTNLPLVEQDPRLPSNMKGVWRFYWPLANSMMVVWGGRALLIAVVARAVDGQLALAAWPAGWGLTLVVANATRMVQQVVIKNHEVAGRRLMLAFATSVGITFSLFLIAIGVSDVGERIVDAFVGRNEELAARVQPVVLMCAAIPILIAIQNGVQGMLISGARTGRINAATWIGTTCLVAVAFLGVRAQLPGATAAALAMVTAILVETIWLALGLRHSKDLKASTATEPSQLRSFRKKVRI